MRIDRWLSVAVVATLYTGVALAEETRLALVIAQSDYSEPLSDIEGAFEEAAVIRSALSDANFEITSHTDLSAQELNDTVDAFERKVANAGADTVVFFYYTGHGLQDPSTTQSYLMGIDARPKSIETVKTGGIELRHIRNRFDRLNTKATFLVFDACRNIPELAASATSDSKGFKRRVTGVPEVVGLTSLDARSDMLIAYATSLNDVAEEGAYAPVLAEALRRPYQGAAAAFDEVQRRVADQSGNRQKPWVNDLLFKEICFVSCPPEALLASGQAAGLKRSQAEAILASFGWEGIPVEQWGDRLSDSARKLNALELQLASVNFEDDAVLELTAKVRRAIENAEFSAADEILSNIEALDLAAGEQRLRRAANRMEQRGDLKLITGDYQSAAKQYERSAAVFSILRLREEWGRLKVKEAQSYVDLGRRQSTGDTLNRANSILLTTRASLVEEKINANVFDIEVLRSAISLDRLQEGDLDVVVSTLEILDSAFNYVDADTQNVKFAQLAVQTALVASAFGYQQDSHELLEAAEGMLGRAYVAAGGEQATPQMKSYIFGNHGAVLLQLAGDEDSEKLRRAINLIQLAMHNDEASNNWSNWSVNAVNLATAAITLAKIDNDIELINSVVLLLDSIIEKNPKDISPIIWADAMTTLGTAQIAKSDLGDDTALENALDVLLAVTDVVSKEDTPKSWATLHANIGAAYAALWESQNSDDHKKKAQAHFAYALTVFDEVDFPRDHETIKSNLRDLGVH